jgi:hypothetical protein
MPRIKLTKSAIDALPTPCASSILHPRQKSWLFPTQMRTETRLQFEFPVQPRKSLFAPKNSLFRCVGNFAANYEQIQLTGIFVGLPPQPASAVSAIPEG